MTTPIREVIEKALAAGPTDGPWKSDSLGSIKIGRYTLCTPGSGGSFSLMEASNIAKKNAAHIAAVNPANMRQLLADHDARVKALEGELVRVRSALNAMLTHMGMDEDEWNKPTFDQARAALRSLL